MAQIGTPSELGDTEKPIYASLLPSQSLESITFEEALELFKLPRDLGDYKGEPIVANTGRFGPYVKVGDKYVNLPRTTDLLALSLEEAIEAIKAKEAEDAPVGTYKGEPITKGKGRFGPYIKWSSLFVNIPARYKLETITLEQMHELIEAKIEKENNRYIHNWIDTEGISVENARFGPTIKFKKKFINLPAREDKQKWTSELAAELSLDDVKSIIEKALPGSFSGDKGGSKAKTKSSARKPAAKASTAKTKTTTKKAASKKAK